MDTQKQKRKHVDGDEPTDEKKNENHSPKKKKTKEPTKKQPIVPPIGTHVLDQMHSSMLGGQLDCSTYFVVTNATKSGHTITLQSLHEKKQYRTKARWSRKNEEYRRNHGNGWYGIIIDTIDSQLEQTALDLLKNGPLTKTQIMNIKTPSFCNEQTVLFGLNQLISKGLVFVKTLGIEPTYSTTPFPNSDSESDVKPDVSSDTP